mmetsp:Transcript_7046/g.20368  ORF Transcript_7046/g.20368 Transcript_7046/m.20368 type:complete len:287 (+) Transcript_7046:3013-3873(+)
MWSDPDAALVCLPISMAWAIAHCRPSSSWPCPAPSADPSSSEPSSIGSSSTSSSNSSAGGWWPLAPGGASSSWSLSSSSFTAPDRSVGTASPSANSLSRLRRAWSRRRSSDMSSRSSSLPFTPEPVERCDVVRSAVWPQSTGLGAGVGAAAMIKAPALGAGLCGTSSVASPALCSSVDVERWGRVAWLEAASPLGCSVPLIQRGGAPTSSSAAAVGSRRMPPGSSALPVLVDGPPPPRSKVENSRGTSSPAPITENKARERSERDTRFSSSASPPLSSLSSSPTPA